MSAKKAFQLGESLGAASNRLIKDLLFKLAIETGHRCHQCGEALTRDQFSIEHKTPWLDSDDPIKNFFDLENIAFSHRRCNIRAARRPNRLPLTTEQRREWDNATERRRWQALSKEQQRAERRAKYLRNGV